MMLLFKSPGYRKCHGQPGSWELLGSYKFQVPSFVHLGIALPPMPRRDNCKQLHPPLLRSSTAANPTRLRPLCSREAIDNQPSQNWATGSLNAFQVFASTFVSPSAKHMVQMLSISILSLSLSCQKIICIALKLAQRQRRVRKWTEF